MKTKVSTNFRTYNKTNSINILTKITNVITFAGIVQTEWMGPWAIGATWNGHPEQRIYIISIKIILKTRKFRNVCHWFKRNAPFKRGDAQGGSLNFVIRARFRPKSQSRTTFYCCTTVLKMLLLKLINFYLFQEPFICCILAYDTRLVSVEFGCKDAYRW